jgi:hypothetical protein
MWPLAAAGGQQDGMRLLHYLTIIRVHELDGVAADQFIYWIAQDPGERRTAVSKRMARSTLHTSQTYCP